MRVVEAEPSGDGWLATRLTGEATERSRSDVPDCPDFARDSTLEATRA